MNDYFDKLDSTWFPKIHNRHLTEVDAYNNYEEVGERESSVVIPDFYELSSAGTDLLTSTLPLTLRAEHSVIDLRTPEEFAVSHLPGAVNIHLKSLIPNQPSPFADSHVFAAQWKELEALFGGGCLDTASDLAKELSLKKKVLLVCDGGDTARVAASILRAKGANAECMKGGMKALVNGFCVLVKKEVNGEVAEKTLLKDIPAVEIKEVDQNSILV